MASGASSAVSQCVIDAGDQIAADAAKILRSTPDEKAPVLKLSCAISVDLRTGGMTVKLSGGTKFKVSCSQQLELNL